MSDKTNYYTYLRNFLLKIIKRPTFITVKDLAIGNWQTVDFKDNKSNNKIKMNSVREILEKYKMGVESVSSIIRI